MPRAMNSGRNSGYYRPAIRPTITTPPVNSPTHDPTDRTWQPGDFARERAGLGQPEPVERGRRSHRSARWCPVTLGPSVLAVHFLPVFWKEGMNNAA